MKKLYTILVALLMTATTFAQAPEKMSYQAVVRVVSGALVSEQVIGMKISILQTTATGTAVYVETQMPTTNVNGLVTLEIGSGTAVSGDFTTIDWANDTYFIKTEIDPTGGTSYNITGTSQLLSVPYALHAKTAESLVGGGSGGGGFTHYIGEEFGGGVVFHLWKDASGVEHGLIVDKTDLSTSQVWSNIDATLIGASAQSSWDGLSNSNAIVGQAGHTSSASALCLNSTNGGQSDWYLPSVQELNMLWNNYYTVARSLTQISGATQLQPTFYWSSTEYGTSAAGYFFFDYGPASSSLNKGTTYYVRAVRAF
ncbi:Legionella vir region protein [Flavobacteria bacterium BAL38]|nr:Legionella vir region protein [Flavobacteria bacterium BAL38]